MPVVHVSFSLQQRNLKQRFVALLKRFKVSEDLQTVFAGNQEIEQKLSGMPSDVILSE